MQALLSQPERRVAGARQALRALNANRAERVYLANDASPKLRGEVLSAADAAGAAVDESFDMAALGRACRIAVPCAVAVILKTALS